MVPLKLTEPADDLKVLPEQLFQKLLHATANLDTLVQELNCTPEDLVETLTDTRTPELLRLKAQLASMQVKLLAIHYMPHAMARIVKLTEADKPEVARRAANTVINMAGVPTETKSQPPTLTLDRQEEIDQQSGKPHQHRVFEVPQEEAQRLIGLMAFGESVRRAGVDVAAIERCDHDRFAKLLVDFFAAEGIPNNPPPRPHGR